MSLIHERSGYVYQVKQAGMKIWNSLDHYGDNVVLYLIIIPNLIFENQNKIA